MHWRGEDMSDLHAIAQLTRKGFEDKKKGKGNADKNKQEVPSQTKALIPRKRKILIRIKLVTHFALSLPHDWALEEEQLPSLISKNLPILARLACKSFNVKVFETFKVFKAEVELQLGKKIKALRSDRGGEYLSQEFKDYLSENGIVQNLTSPYTPQQNGVSERRNRSKDYLGKCFYVKDLGKLHTYWELRYIREDTLRLIGLPQSAYNIDKGILRNSICKTLRKGTRPDVAFCLKTWSDRKLDDTGGAVTWKGKKQTPLRCIRHKSSTWLRQKLQWKQLDLGSLYEDVGVMPSISKYLLIGIVTILAAILFANEPES
ncbi:retrotransposon protein, putative, ty1-copia subclass [Tanacetum coccineum]